MQVSEKQQLWYVLRIKPRHDKKAADCLKKMGISCFLPLQKQWHQWSDRRKLIEVPVLSPYLFVKLAATERNTVFHATGVLSYLKHNGAYAQVSEGELNVLKAICNGKDPFDFVSTEYHKNDVVKICAGPFEGIQARVKESRKSKILLHLTGIGSIVECEIPVEFIKKVS